MWGGDAAARGDGQDPRGLCDRRVCDEAVRRLGDVSSRLRSVLPVALAEGAVKVGYGLATVGGELPGAVVAARGADAVGDLAAERVLFEEHALQPVGDGSEGLLREEDLAAVVVVGLASEGYPQGVPLQPCGEWLLVETAGAVSEESGLAVPEAYRKRPRCGRVVDAGLGQMRRKGPLAGTRTPLAQVLGVIPPVEGLLVYWEKRARMLAVAGSGRLLLVRVGDVLAVEEEENDNGNFVERGGPDRAVAGVAVEGDFGSDGHQ